MEHIACDNRRFHWVCSLPSKGDRSLGVGNNVVGEDNVLELDGDIVRGIGVVDKVPVVEVLEGRSSDGEGFANVLAVEALAIWVGVAFSVDDAVGDDEVLDIAFFDVENGVGAAVAFDGELVDC